MIRVSTRWVNFHVLKDTQGLYLVDAGFIGGMKALQAALVRKGWERLPIRGIILSHGHLDHILNVAKLVRETGAWIAAPRLDMSFYNGEGEYSGWSRIAGILESLGRQMLGFEPFAPDRLIEDGDRLDVWRGLRAVHLPGHTAGHMGYLCEERGLLFSGDLFASFEKFSHLPPKVFNLNPELLQLSMARALSLELRGVIPNHGDGAEPDVHLRRLRKVAKQEWS